jgi:hypothetical protein
MVKIQMFDLVRHVNKNRGSIYYEVILIINLMRSIMFSKSIHGKISQSLTWKKPCDRRKYHYIYIYRSNWSEKGHCMIQDKALFKSVAQHCKSKGKGKTLVILN